MRERTDSMDEKRQDAVFVTETGGADTENEESN
jgi:hypothetical protein